MRGCEACVCDWHLSDLRGTMRYRLRYPMGTRAVMTVITLTLGEAPLNRDSPDIFILPLSVTNT